MLLHAFTRTIPHFEKWMLATKKKNNLIAAIIKLNENLRRMWLERLTAISPDIVPHESKRERERERERQRGKERASELKPITRHPSARQHVTSERERMR